MTWGKILQCNLKTFIRGKYLHICKYWSPQPYVWKAYWKISHSPLFEVHPIVSRLFNTLPYLFICTRNGKPAPRCEPTEGVGLSGRRGRVKWDWALVSSMQTTPYYELLCMSQLKCFYLKLRFMCSTLSYKPTPTMTFWFDQLCAKIVVGNHLITSLISLGSKQLFTFLWGLKTLNVAKCSSTFQAKIWHDSLAQILAPGLIAPMRLLHSIY